MTLESGVISLAQGQLGWWSARFEGTCHLPCKAELMFDQHRILRLIFPVVHRYVYREVAYRCSKGFCLRLLAKVAAELPISILISSKEAILNLNPVAIFWPDAYRLYHGIGNRPGKSAVFFPPLRPGPDGDAQRAQQERDGRLQRVKGLKHPMPTQLVQLLCEKRLLDDR